MNDLIPVGFFLERTVDVHANVVGLLLRQLSQLRTDVCQVQFRYFLIQMLWQYIYFIFVAGVVVPQFQLSQRLVGEAVTHHKARVAHGTTQVHQATFSQYDDLVAFQVVNVNLWLNGLFGFTIVLVQPSHIDFIVEVSDVTNDGFVFH